MHLLNIYLKKLPRESAYHDWLKPWYNHFIETDKFSVTCLLKIRKQIFCVSIEKQKHFKKNLNSCGKTGNVFGFLYLTLIQFCYVLP